MNIKHVLTVLLLLLIIAPQPVASQDNKKIVFISGSALLGPFEEYAFNWTWWELDSDRVLVFIMTTNNFSHPVRFSVNNTQQTVIEVYDYFFLGRWGSSELLDPKPNSEETWWFTFENIANKSFYVDVSLTYKPLTEEQRGWNLIFEVVAVAGVILVVGLVVYLFRRDRNKHDRGRG